jgi:hypothetical protein
VNASELLTLLGLAWSRLVIYPGGLALIGLIWLITRTENPEPRTENREPRTENREPSIQRRSGQVNNGSWFLVLSSIIPPWLGLALLPLPAAAPMNRKTDIIIVLALLEWPRIVAIAHELCSADTTGQRAGARRLAAALNSYPALMLATLALAQPAGSLEIAALARSPSEMAALSIKALHWLGAAAWTLALPALLGLGPFQASVPVRKSWRAPVNGLELGMWLRGCGLASIAALPWLAPSGALAEQGDYSTATLLAILVAPFALGGLLWCYHRCTAHQSARRWARAYLALDCLLLFALLWAAYAALPRS